MLNFVEFVLLIVLVLLLAITIFLATGIIYTKPGFVSIIEWRGAFFCIESRRISFAFPIIYKKVASYPIKPTVYKINGKEITIMATDVMLLYKNKINIKRLLKENKNLEETLKTYKIKIIK